MSRTLWRAGLRHLARRPWQAGLSIAGIALGVAVVVAIDLASASALRAFSLSTEGVVGRATHRIVGGPSGLPEALYRALRVEAAVRPSAPVVEGYVSLPRLPGRALHLLGVDPLAEPPFRPYLGRGGTGRGESPGGLSPLLTRPGAVLLSSGTARVMGLAAGDRFEIKVGGLRRTAMLAGVLAPADATSGQALDGLMVTDIASAQELLGKLGRLSRIDLIVPAGPAGLVLTERIASLLPPGADLAPAAAGMRAAEQMIQAFAVNLTALSLLALLVGMFLIYNAMTFAVVQRRAAIGVLRALGVTRREIFLLLAVEALALGVVATAAGLGLGVVLGRGLVHLVTRTINDLYFVVAVRELTVPFWALLKGAALGIATTLLATVPPALEATLAPPRVVLSRSALETRARSAVGRAAAAGALLLAVGALLLVPSGSLALSYAGLFVLVLGFALLTPSVTVILMRLLEPMAGRLLGIQGRLAVRGVVAALSRTSVATAALMVAIATAASVSIMVTSFRQTVEEWLTGSLQSDVYVSLAAPVATGTEVTMDPALVERLRSAPGVASLSTQRSVIVQSASGPTRLIALDLLSHRGFRFKGPHPWDLGEAWESGAVIVSEPYAYRHGVDVGARLRLRTDRGEHAFPVAGIFYDYASDRGLVMMSRRTYHRHWDDRGVSGIAIQAAPGIEAAALIETLRARAGSAEDLLIRSNRALRQASLDIFDRTFVITNVLRLLALLVAVIGVLSALMALAFERERELAILRSQGLTPGQLWGLVTAQTGLMGLVAGLLAVPVGIALALILVFVINRRSFGWTLGIDLGPGDLVQIVALALVAAVLAGIIPAARMVRTSPATSLREE